MTLSSSTQTICDIFLFTKLFGSILSMSLNLRFVVLTVIIRGSDCDSRETRNKIAADIVSFQREKNHDSNHKVIQHFLFGFNGNDLIW